MFRISLSFVIILFVQSAATAQIGFESRLVGNESRVKSGRFQIIKDAVLTVDDDAVELVRRPWQNPNRIANGVKLFALVATDYSTTQFFQQHIEPLDVHIRSVFSFPSLFPSTPVLRRWARGVDGYMYTGVTTMYAVGFLVGNEKMQEAGVLTTKAVIESYVVSHIVLKSLVARHRPARPLGDMTQFDNDSQYPFVHSPLDFFNFHVPYLHSNAYGTGFPSYHATMFFAFASVNSKVFNNSWVPYALATTALLYDIRGHNHWVSELVAGAVIGEFIGKVVYENYHKQKRDSHEKKTSRITTNLGVGQAFGQPTASFTLSW